MVEVYKLPQKAKILDIGCGKGYLLFDLTMGQILSLIMILAGLVLFYFKNENKQIN